LLRILYHFHSGSHASAHAYLTVHRRVFIKCDYVVLQKIDPSSNRHATENIRQGTRFNVYHFNICQSISREEDIPSSEPADVLLRVLGVSYSRDLVVASIASHREIRTRDSGERTAHRWQSKSHSNEERRGEPQKGPRRRAPRNDSAPPRLCAPRVIILGRAIPAARVDDNNNLSRGHLAYVQFGV
jgi:hypothetical protein